MSNCIPQAGSIGTAKMVALLADGASATEIHEITGLHKSTIMRMVHALRALERCYICDWIEDRHGRKNTAVHKIGKGVDKVKPPPRRADKDYINAGQRDRYNRKTIAQRLGLL